jgi:Phage tail tube protein
MALRSGLAGQWAAIDETTYGVVPPLAAALFYAADNDSLKLKKTPKQGSGIFAGSLAPRASRRAITEYSAGGALPMDLPQRQMNPWLYRSFGSYGQAAAVLTQDASTGAYKSTHVLGALEGHSFALQKGAPTVDNGTVVPITYSGCKVSDWEIAATMGEIAKLTLTIEARNEIAGSFKDPLNASVPGLQAFVAPPGGVFTWVGGSVLYGGTPSTTPIVAAPSAPTVTPAGSGGTVLAGTYQVTVTYTNVQGETVASTATPVTTSGSVSTITITSPAAAAYATNWYAYVSQAGGTALAATRQQAPGSPTLIGTNLVITAPPTSTGAVAQLVNTAGATTTLTSPTVAGNIKGPISVKCARPLDLTRYAIDVAPFRNEPIQNAVTQPSGSFGVEWLSAETYYAAYQADTATSIVYNFLGPAIGSGADFSTLSILCSNIRLDGDSPSVSGPAVLEQVVPWSVFDDAANSIIQATYWTLDST